MLITNNVLQSFCNVVPFECLSGHFTVYDKGRNFGLKSGGTNSEGERGAVGSQDDTGGQWEERGGIPSHPTKGLSLRESVMISLCGVRSTAPAENGFIVIKYPQIASVDSIYQQNHLFILKSGVQYPSVQKAGVRVSFVNYAYGPTIIVNYLWHYSFKISRQSTSTIYFLTYHLSSWLLTVVSNFVESVSKQAS